MHFKEDILGEYQKKESEIFRFNFCLSFLVFVLYWGMYFTNRDGVLARNRVVPPVLDFLLHGGNFFANLFTHIKLMEKNEVNLNISWKFFISFSFLYTSFYKIIYFIFDFPVYPLVSKMNLKIFILLSFIGSCLLILGEYLFLKGLGFRKKENIMKSN